MIIKNPPRRLWARTLLLLACAMVAALPAMPAAGDGFRVPLLTTPPTIDGRIDPAEWRDAAGFDGFVTQGTLQRRRVRAWVGADEKTIYVAIQSQLPDAGPLAAAVKSDSLKAVYDDAVEVFVDPTPDAPDHVDYQFLCNSLGKGGYGVHKSGNTAEEESWSGNWRSASRLADGWWHFECAIPVASMKMSGPGRKTTDGAWRINLCRDWKPDWAWSSLAPAAAYANSGDRFVFTRQGAPAVQHVHDGDPSLPPSRGRLTLRNPTGQPLELRASLDLVRNRMPEISRRQTFSLKPGQASFLDYAIDENDPTTVFELSLKVASADQRAIFYDRTVKWTRAKEPLRWITQRAAPVAPLDLLLAYYPSQNRLRLAADLNGLPRDARPSRVTATVRSASDKRPVKSVDFPLAGFRGGRQEQTVELPPLEGQYEIALRAEGQGVPPGELVKRFQRHKFPWENTPLGRSTKVYPPFTPIRMAGRTLQTVLRTHQLNDVGLLDQVACTSANTGVTKPLLAAPMRYVVKLDGSEVPVAAAPLKVITAKENEVQTEGRFQAGGLAASFRDTWDYDGTVKVDLSMESTGGRSLDALWLEIPFLAEAAPLIHANSDRIRAPVAQAVPAGEGPVWNASKVACDEFLKNFCPYVYLGSGVRGLAWFAENDKGWAWDPATPNLDVVRRGGQVVLRVHLVNRPLVVTSARRLSFGLLAVPVKPMLNVAGTREKGDRGDRREKGDSPHLCEAPFGPFRQMGTVPFFPAGYNGWRYRFLRDNYHLLGTDINWLALGDCGSVYPAGKDLLLWETIKQGSLGRLTAAQEQAAIDRGRAYFEPYGPEAVETFVRHARHNFESHRGAKMVFYYNRASCQLFDEFETFKDEWCLDDLRAVGEGKGRGEIKVVPSASYIDYNLYWYARSFELAGNEGVYWDNWFFAPSYNTGMTDAYRREDGSVAPAAGIWGLRELAKRTFVLMNERGMRPVTFPHITSFSPLPLLSFATMQYDWEWKYSEGDVQDRYRPEYLQLVSTGELAGAWPVLLGDQGPLGDDPWTQRTFSAVRIVHELDGQGGFGMTWMKSHQESHRRLGAPVLAMLDRPGLVVYKYWEDRPSPVTASSAEVPTIVYSVPGREALVAAVSYARTDLEVTLRADLAALGLPRDCSATDVETGAPLALRDGRLVFSLKRHDIKLVRLWK